MDYFTCNIYEYLNQLVFTDIEVDDTNILFDDNKLLYNASALYADYVNFCKQQKYVELTTAKFGSLMHAITDRPAINGRRFYVIDKIQIKDYLIKNNYWFESICQIEDSEDEQSEESEYEEVSGDSEDEEIVFVPMKKSEE